MELTVNISADSHWRTHWLHITFFYKQLFDFFAEHAQISFGEDATVSDYFQPLVGIAVEATHLLFASNDFFEFNYYT